MGKIFLLIILLDLFAINLFTQETTEPKLQSLSLKQACDFALENNPNIINARLDLLIAKKKVWETTTIGLPQVNSTINYNNYLDIATQLIPGEFFGMPAGTYAEVQFGTKHNANASITATQLIFSGEYIVGLQAAKVYKQLSENNLLKNQNDVRESITQTYYLILLAEENKKILEKSLINTKQIHSDLVKTFQAGFIDETNADQLKLTYINIENSIRAIERQKDLAIELLKLYLGFSVEDKIELTDNIESLFSGIEVNSLVEKPFVIENHIDYKLLNTQEKLSNLDVKRYKASLLPTFSAFFTHQQNAMRNDFNFFDNSEKWFPTTIIGGSLNIPIFGSGMKLSKIQQARLSLEKTIHTKDMLAQSLEIGVIQAKSDLITSYDKYNNLKENLDLSEKIYNQYLKKFKEGTVSGIELTQSQNQYLSTQSSYIGAMVEMLNAKNKLDKALNNY